jgi:hypothetical protein
VTQSKTWDDIEIPRLKFYLFLFAYDKTLPFIDVIYPEIRTEHIGVIPLFIQLNIVDMQKGEVITCEMFSHVLS